MKMIILKKDIDFFMAVSTTLLKTSTNFNFAECGCWKGQSFEIIFVC